MTFSLIPIAHAATDPDALANVLNPIIHNIVDPLIGLVFAVAVVVFAFGVFQFIWGGEDKREDGKNSMLYGVVGMFIMVSAWGIVYLIANTVQGFK